VWKHVKSYGPLKACLCCWVKVITGQKTKALENFKLLFFNKNYHVNNMLIYIVELGIVK